MKLSLNPIVWNGGGGTGGSITPSAEEGNNHERSISAATFRIRQHRKPADNPGRHLKPPTIRRTPTPMGSQTPIQPWQRQAQYVYGPGMSDKSKVTAAMYAFFLGEFGIHNFYLGRTGRGVAQLLITIFLAVIVIGPIISWVWSIVEGAQILGSHPGSPYHQDGNGLELQD